MTGVTLNVDWPLWDELVEDGWDEVEAFRRATSLRFPGALNERAGEQAAKSAETAAPFEAAVEESRLVGPIRKDGPPPRSLNADRGEAA